MRRLDTAFGWIFAWMFVIASACSESEPEGAASAGGETTEVAELPPPSPPMPEGAPPTDDSTSGGSELSQARTALADHLARQGIEDPDVLAAIRAVPRHRFMPEEVRRFAYQDRPLPIGWDQTISQPYIVALMTELAEVEEGEKVLEIGTGSGYQAAVLAEQGAEVYSIEIVEPLGERAAKTLRELGYGESIHTRIGDGYRGWPDQAPFDAIVITAAPPEIPDPLKEQLAVGGRMVVPVGEDRQQLVVLTRTEEGLERVESIPVRFVPMTGEAQTQ